MARIRKEDKDNVVVLGTSAQPKGKGPTDIDCKAYDRLVQEVYELQEITTKPGWKRFFGGLLREAEEARDKFETVEKSKDLAKLQATIALVKNQLRKLQQPVDDLNAMRTKWPLFTGEMPWKARFDEATGSAVLVWAGQGPAPVGPPQPTEHSAGSAEDAPPADAPPAHEPTPPTPDEDEDEDGEDDDLDPGGAEDDDPFGN